MRFGRSRFFFALVSRYISRLRPAIAGKDHLIVAWEDSVKTMDYYQTTQRIGVNVWAT